MIAVRLLCDCYLSIDPCHGPRHVQFHLAHHEWFGATLGTLPFTAESMLSARLAPNTRPSFYAVGRRAKIALSEQRRAAEAHRKQLRKNILLSMGGVFAVGLVVALVGLTAVRTAQF